MFNDTKHSEQHGNFRHGPFVSVRPLKRVHGCDRIIMLHEHKRTNHLLYRFDHIMDPVARRRVFDRFMKVARLNHQHILEVQHAAYDSTGRLCVITDYPGNQDGLVTLQDLLDTRGGRLDFHETTRLMEQLLNTSEHAQSRGIVHGPFSLSELLVDRHGCTVVELFGLAHALRSSHSDNAALADQTRSIAQLGLAMLTGVTDTDEAFALAPMTKRSERAWENWFHDALDPIQGFETPRAAIDAIPGTNAAAHRQTELKPVASKAPRRLGVPRFRIPTPGKQQRDS